MTSTGTNAKKATPINIAGRRMKQWIVQSLASAPRKARKFVKHRRAASDATISTTSLATILLVPEPKCPLKANEASQVIHDVLLPSETIRTTLHRRSTDGAALSGSSGSSSSSNGRTDSDSVAASTSPDDYYQEPPFLQRRHCDECQKELGENGVCACAPGVAVVPSSPLPSAPRVLSPVLSVSSRGDEDTSPIHTPDVDQIPDEEGISVEITEVNQEPDGDAGSDKSADPRDPWGQTQGGWGLWAGPESKTWTVTDAVEIQTGGPKTPSPAPISKGSEPQEPPSTTPPLAETEEASTFLYSSDERMTLTLRSFLGAGSHGTVVSADWAEGQRQVAVKVSHKLYISELDCTEPGLKNLKKELDVLKALKTSREYRELGSNFFPELFKSWQDTKNVYFVMDLYPWNLEDLRWADPDWDVTTGDKVLWAAEMILGVQALHRMRILHRDIKPANVFVTCTRHIIIGDYGLAHAWLDPFYANFPSSSLKARDAPGTMSYLAPEVLKGFYEDQVNFEVGKYASYGFEADIWSLGVTICESWSQSGGLFGLQEEEKHLDYRSAIPFKILQMDVQPAVKQIVDGHPIWHLITRMLDRDPKTRIGFNEILAHPVFAHLDWNRVANLDYTPAWNFPEAESSSRPKPVKDKLQFAFYYKSPGDICLDEADSEQTRANKLDRQETQILRRAMGAARDWVGEQPTWIRNETLGEYDFGWTAPEVIAEDEKWSLDSD